ncbi:hypothetical protein BDK51DRAFT_41091 [Blyttiomyces helicus]|uniref:Uncharacterized protein n=1 Tax=Blyttiomyces helicus TaxID=388810 RepID=A0A4V1IPF9_9FUNG|nr:hypothetical protein BDK51DRAFT_41091 [Blyttiomyces helicus]|eukprot:RKO82917.1 hypothetical protein BDK51DRAFT_41091 [Blyttiomyces helicus]
MQLRRRLMADYMVTVHFPQYQGRSEIDKVGKEGTGEDGYIIKQDAYDSGRARRTQSGWLVALAPTLPGSGEGRHAVERACEASSDGEAAGDVELSSPGSMSQEAGPLWFSHVSVATLRQSSKLLREPNHTDVGERKGGGSEPGRAGTPQLSSQSRAQVGGRPRTGHGVDLHQEENALERVGMSKPGLVGHPTLTLWRGTEPLTPDSNIEAESE